MEFCDRNDNDCDGTTDEEMTIRIGDDDGYGYGTSNYNDLPTADPDDQFCYGSGSCGNYTDEYTCVELNGCTWADWIFDNRETSERNASDGSRNTDQEPFSSRSFEFTMTFPAMQSDDVLDTYFEMDVSGIQPHWGESSIYFDGDNYSWMLPYDQGIFGSGLYSVYLDASVLEDGSLTVTFEGGQDSGGDAIAFDFFELYIICSY